MGRLTSILTAFLLTAPLAAGAQVLPGGQLRDRNAMRAEFLDAVLEGIRGTTADWLRAWADRDAERLAEVYAEEAYLVLPTGETLRGRADVAAHFGALAEDEAGILEVFLQDVDASNQMAMVVSRYLLRPRVIPSQMPELRGSVLTVWVSDGHRWRIRSQVFHEGG